MDTERLGYTVAFASQRTKGISMDGISNAPKSIPVVI